MMRHPSTDNVHHNTKGNTMKPTRNILFGFVVASATLIAGSVTIPHSFTANTTAKASEVNENFSAVKTAVDGNANDIATNKADITTNANNMITGVTATGGLTGGGNSGSVTVRKKDGNISIPPTAFISHRDSECPMIRDYYSAYFDSTHITISYCRAHAPVSLPNGAAIKSLTCTFYNNDPNISSNPSVNLYKYRFSTYTGFAYSLLEVRSGDDKDEAQTITENGTNSDEFTVDNGQYKYTLTYAPPQRTDQAGNIQKILGCSIEYSYQ